MNNTEKYKVAMIYMEMLENPRKFKHLNRFLPSINNKKIRIKLNDLPEEDIKEFKEM